MFDINKTIEDTDRCKQCRTLKWRGRICQACKTRKKTRKEQKQELGMQFVEQYTFEEDRKIAAYIVEGMSPTLIKHELGTACKLKAQGIRRQWYYFLDRNNL
jgi:hypothetical protein